MLGRTYQVQFGRWESIEPGCVQIASPALIGGEPAQRQPSAHGTGPITQRILLEYFLDRQSASRGFHQCRQIVVIIGAKRPKPVTIDQEPDMFGRFKNTDRKSTRLNSSH